MASPLGLCCWCFHSFCAPKIQARPHGAWDAKLQDRALGGAWEPLPPQPVGPSSPSRMDLYLLCSHRQRRLPGSMSCHLAVASLASPPAVSLSHLPVRSPHFIQKGLPYRRPLPRLKPFVASCRSQDRLQTHYHGVRGSRGSDACPPAQFYLSPNFPFPNPRPISMALSHSRRYTHLVFNQT